MRTYSRRCLLRLRRTAGGGKTCRSVRAESFPETGQRARAADGTHRTAPSSARIDRSSALTTYLLAYLRLDYGHPSGWSDDTMVLVPTRSDGGLRGVSNIVIGLKGADHVSPGSRVGHCPCIGSLPS